MTLKKYESFKRDMILTFRVQSSTELIRKLDSYFPGEYYSIGDLFVDQRRNIFEAVTRKMYEEQAALFEDFYQKNKDIASIIKSHEAKLPETFLAAAGFVINRILLSELKKLADGFYPDELKSILEEATFWNIHPDLTSASVLISRCVNTLMLEFEQNPSDIQKAREILRFLELAKNLQIEMDLEDSQIVFFEIITKLKKQKIDFFPSIFKDLADKFYVKLPNSNSK